MGIEEIIGAISSAGFPAAICVYALYQSYKQQERHEARVDSLVNAHKDETTKITEAINNNTIALTQLVDELHGGERNG